MKIVVVILSVFLLLLVSVLPLGTLICLQSDYVFSIKWPSVYMVVTAGVAVCLAFLSVKMEGSPGVVTKVLVSLMTPVSVIHGFLSMIQESSVWVVVSALVIIGCCMILTARFGNPSGLLGTGLVATVFLLLPVGLFGFATLLFGGLRENTVVKTLDSPSGAYYAQVIDSDQGALGGDTLVKVYDKKGIDGLLFHATKKPQQVYFGDWAEYKTMEIYWKDDNCLVINSVEYKIA